MGSSDKSKKQAYSRGYYRGKKTAEKVANQEPPPLSAKKQKEDLDNALKRFREL